MTSEGPSVIYLDHNATTPLAPEVAEDMAPYLGAEFGNPSSDHALGRRARQAVEEARASVAALIGAAASEVVFTSGGTESNNLAIRGVAAQAPAHRRRIVTSAIEHPATAAPLALLEASGWTLTRVPVAASGILDLDAALAAAQAIGRIAQLRDELWTALSARVDGIRRHTPDDANLANTLLVTFPGVVGTDVLARVPQLAASTGSACHAGEHTPNATLLAMGNSPEVASGAVRLSLGRGTTRAEIEAAVELLAGAHGALVATMPSPTSPSTSKGTPR